MPTFQAPQVPIPDDAKERARAFAFAVTGTVNYKDSNQDVIEKIRDDHFVSKLGEEAARILFEGRNCLVEGPDYGVYEAKRKSWAADLRVNDLEVAVKTQRRSAANRYGLSWTFGFAQTAHPILDRPMHGSVWLYSEDLKEGTECVVHPLRKIKQLIFEAPALQDWSVKNQAVYLRDADSARHHERMINSPYAVLLQIVTLSGAEGSLDSRGNCFASLKKQGVFKPICRRFRRLTRIFKTIRENSRVIRG
ncbi:MAG: hypothetical protein IPG44_11790 [Anaerolineales bacterium]|nr:hypothetical protein [Anaerolineales bacterium]